YKDLWPFTQSLALTTSFDLGGTYPMNTDSLIPIMLTVMGGLLAVSATYLFRHGTTPPPTPEHPRRTLSASHLVLTTFAMIVVLFGGVTLVRYFPVIKQ